MQTPKDLGYYFPAEWEKHEATWLTFPHHDDSFPGKMKEATDVFMKFVEALSNHEKVRINIHDEQSENYFNSLVEKFQINKERLEIFIHPSDDVWCRDHGPAFLINQKAEKKKVIVNWEFNAWGEKYPFRNDNNIPLLIADKLNLPVFSPGIVMEGGSVEFNGAGTVITSKACLLNKNRNQKLTRPDIEHYLVNYYGVEQVLWLNCGITGDDTDGHIDDLTRFVNKDTIITMVETNRNDTNYGALQENLKLLKKIRLSDNKQPDIIEILMPDAVHYKNQRLPASYANFYICNDAVIVPVFNCENDEKAVNIYEKIFSDRKVIAIDSTHLVWGFGSFHCLSQQEPLV